MGKTIKQIADELGVSKTAVRKKIENLGISEKLQTNGNRIEVDEKQEKLIKSAFSKAEPKTDNQKEVSEKSETLRLLSSMVSALTDQLAEKDKQLEAANKQISDLQEALEKERAYSREQAEKMAQLADQAQKLQLAQMNSKQKRLLLKSEAAGESAVTVEEPKRGLFSWLRKESR